MWIGGWFVVRYPELRRRKVGSGNNQKVNIFTLKWLKKKKSFNRT